MTGVADHTQIGLYADGAVGEAVLQILAERCRDRLAYVVAPTLESPVARRHKALSLGCGLLDWSDTAVRAALPRHMGDVPELVLLAWWPHLVRRPFLDAGQRATLNMHPSLLPHGRGKDPNFWSLVDDSPAGVTIHHVDEGIDSGPIAFQATIETDWTDTGGSLYAKAQEQMIRLFSDSLDAMLSFDIPRLEQPAEAGSFHRRADLAPRSLLDLDRLYSGREMLNLLRARTFAPHPGCRFSDRGEIFQVRVEIEKIEECS